MPATDLPNAVTVSADETTDVIEVIGSRKDEVLKIDRRTYEVRETPHSAQKTAVQLLRGLPAVTVTPDDRILVLGAGVTRIYVDGRPYLGDASQFLRTVHGSDIERIEVISNPSAQFSSEGTGGVINLVLRKSRVDGLSGNASLQESTYGHGIIDTTLNYKRRDWTYEFKAGGNIGTMVRRSYAKRRTVEGREGSIGNHEDGNTTYYGTDGRLSGKATYKLDSKTSLSAQLGGGGGRDIMVDKIDYVAASPSFRPFTEHRRLNSVAGAVTGELNVERTGESEGEKLNASFQFYTNPDVHDVTAARLSDGRRYQIDLRKPSTSADAQTDWKHPMASGQILSLGSSWHLDDTSQRYHFTSSDSDGSIGPDTSDAFEASSSTLSAYVSFQQTLGTLTLAPGLRGESNHRRISSLGAEVIRIDRADLFPSFHASYKLGKTLQVGASYSRRIDRVPLEYLRPYGMVENAYTLFKGNPRLEDQNTDAYEVSVQFRPGKIEAGATLYVRETQNLWSKSYSVDSAGTSVYSYVNAGNSWNSGAQFDLSIPVLARLKVRASANLFDERTPTGAGTGEGTFHTFRYSTNGTLEWTGKDRGAVPGDVAQLQWSFNSPSRAYQIREASWFDMSVAYTHSFDSTLSLSGTFRYSGRTRQRLIAPAIEEFTSRRRAPEFQLKLLKTL